MKFRSQSIKTSSQKIRITGILKSISSGYLPTGYTSLFFILFISSFFLINAGESFPGEKNLISIPVDNEYIQTYRGRIGRWTLYEKKNINESLENLGSTLNNMIAMNGFQPGNGDYVFIPMSEQVYNKILEKGFGRKIAQIDRRKFVWPVELPSYSSRFGHRRKGMHLGLDMACARGTVVVAANDGVVKVSASSMGGMGRALMIRHENGLETWYAHNSRLLVKEGEKVNRGQIIAFSGNTGRSTGPHLHFEIRFMDVHLDPEDFLPFGFRNPDVVLRETPGNGFGILSESALLLDSSRNIP